MHINLLAEHDLTKLAAVVNAMADEMGVHVSGEMDDVKRDVSPAAVLDRIEAAQARDSAQD